MNDRFNFRSPAPGEVVEMQLRVKKRREQILKYKVLSQLLDGKTVDVTQSSIIFEALNREQMEFDELLKLHPDQAQDCVDQVKEDRELGRNMESKAFWAVKGHIPLCIYYSRPQEYWRDKKICKEFYRMYPKFMVTK